MIFCEGKTGRKIGKVNLQILHVAKCDVTFCFYIVDCVSYYAVDQTFSLPFQKKKKKPKQTFFLWVSDMVTKFDGAIAQVIRQYLRANIFFN